MENLESPMMLYILIIKKVYHYVLFFLYGLTLRVTPFGRSGTIIQGGKIKT